MSTATASDRECIHCGTHFHARSEEDQFCCRGCEFVHRLILDEGLDRFYDLRRTEKGQPVLERPFQELDLDWLKPLVEKAEADAETSGRPATLRLHVSGISCVGCVWLMEKRFQNQPGSIRATVSPHQSEVELQWQAGDCDLEAWARDLQRFGYMLEKLDPNRPGRSEARRLLGKLGLASAFAMNTMLFTLPRYLGMEEDFMFASLFKLIALAFATFTFVIGGSYFIRKAWSGLQQKTLHIDLPIALGLVLAWLGSIAGWAFYVEDLLYFDFVATFTVLMLGGRYLQLAAIERNQLQSRRSNPVPDVVPLAETGELQAVTELETGTHYGLKGGQVVPVASVLQDDAADFSLLWINGEPDPVTMNAGQAVPSGAQLLNQTQVQLRSRERWDESLVRSLCEISVGERRSPIVEHVLRIYLLAVLVIGSLGGMLWIATTGDVVRALQVTLSVFVVSCPCALGVALPMIDDRAAAAMQKVGVFIRSGTLWARLRSVRQLLLDKTGTLTLERPGLINPEAFKDLDEEALEALHHLVEGSLHPLSRSLAEYLPGHAAGKTVSVQEVPGQGVTMELHGKTWSLGKPGWQSAAGDAEAQICADFWEGNEPRARFRFEESLRPRTRDSILSLLEKAQIQPAILSGDQPGRVQALAAALSIPSDRVHAALSPDQKAELIERMDAWDSLYLGDGANDSLAFEKAWVTGTPVADRSLLEHKADFFFTTRGMGFLKDLFRVSGWRARTVRLAFGFALIYNFVAITICLAGLMTPLLAAILMPASSLATLAIAGMTDPLGRRKPSAQTPDTPRSLDAPSGEWILES